jgi:hypothetical protein
VCGQRAAVILQAAHRGWEPLVVAVDELVDPFLYMVDSPLARCDLVRHLE